MAKYFFTVGLFYFSASILSKTWNAFKWTEGAAELFFVFTVSVIAGLAVWDVLENKNA